MLVTRMPKVLFTWYTLKTGWSTACTTPSLADMSSRCWRCMMDTKKETGMISFVTSTEAFVIANNSNVSVLLCWCLESFWSPQFFISLCPDPVCSNFKILSYFLCLFIYLSHENLQIKAFSLKTLPKVET